MLRAKLCRALYLLQYHGEHGRGSKTATSPITCEGSEPKEAGFIEARRIQTVTWASFHQTVAAARQLKISEV
ncbi:hypothetical protein DID88_000346 [Monilinia fructigena]|uniref:Uncharacterized protein n=1 Tax=Monilinia fructigena TaxID=38457 RepID=A0A395IIJ9_9HELO|nr:hypothetical protein DID88_000346 [Monilinia fructigena]